MLSQFLIASAVFLPVLATTICNSKDTWCCTNTTTVCHWPKSRRSQIQFSTGRRKSHSRHLGCIFYQLFRADWSRWHWVHCEWWKFRMCQWDRLLHYYVLRETLTLAFNEFALTSVHRMVQSVSTVRLKSAVELLNIVSEECHRPWTCIRGFCLSLVKI